MGDGRERGHGVGSGEEGDVLRLRVASVREEEDSGRMTVWFGLGTDSKNQERENALIEGSRVY